MDAREYQYEAEKTLIDEPEKEIPGNHQMIAWMMLGLAGESTELLLTIGKMQEKIKKYVFHGHPLDHLDQEELEEEIGDCLWYLTSFCTLIGVDLETVMESNIEKLEKRYPNGFNQKDSIARKDKNG